MEFNPPTGGFVLWAMFDDERPLGEVRFVGGRLEFWGEPLPRCCPVEVIPQEAMDVQAIAEVLGALRYLGYKPIFQWDTLQCRSAKTENRSANPDPGPKGASRSASRAKKK